MAKAKRKSKTEGSGTQTDGNPQKQLEKSLQAMNPSSLVRRFIDEVDRLADDFGIGRGLLSSVERGLPGAWAPQIEMFERGNQLIMHADLPGLRKEDVKVELFDDAITIEGERRNAREEKQEGFYRSERSYGRFFRRVPLPQGVNTEDAKASFRDGVLEVTMTAPKSKSKGARRLEIGDGEAPRANAKAA